MSDERITKKIFTWDHAIRQNNWSSQLAEIIQSVSCYNVFNSKLPVCMVNLSNSLQVINENDWKTNVNSKPKLRLYSKFKENFKADDYVLSLMPRYERSLLAQLRLGILPLRVETGRFVNESLNNRICTLCNLLDIEDEIHFVCRCPIYDNPRLQLFQIAFEGNPNFYHLTQSDKFIYLVKHHYKKLAIFIKQSWQIRQNLIYRQNE